MREREGVSRANWKDRQFFNACSPKEREATGRSSHHARHTQALFSVKFSTAGNTLSPITSVASFV